MNEQAASVQSASLSGSIFISAGETSGDLHGSALLRELKQISSEHISISGLGGDKIENEGVHLLYHTNELAAIGFIDVIKKLSFFKKVLKDSIQYVKKNNPEVIILVDYPGFNIKFAQELRKFYKKKIIYYISPQLWAWHKSRVYKIKKYVDKMLVVFPFEADFYKEFDVNAEYVGHPLVKLIKELKENKQPEKKIFGSEKTITVLPGSRKNEIKYHLPVILQMLKQLSKEFDLKVNISKAPGLSDEVFLPFGDELKKYNLTSDNVYNLILNSDLVLTKSGTSTMETGLLGTPFIIFYKTSTVNYNLLKPFVKVSSLGMVNILAKENIIKEFIQDEFTSENLLEESRKILTDFQYRESITKKLEKLWEILGDKDASLTAAEIIKKETLT